MKKIFTIVIAILSIIICHAQYTYQVANSQQVRKDIRPIATDNNGNTIITGYFTYSITFGAITLTDNSGRDIWFVAKMLSNGTFAWAKMLIPLSISGGTSFSQIHGVNTDATGNVYLTGNFLGKIGVGVANISLSSTKNGNTYTTDIFTLKLTPDGV